MARSVPPPTPSEEAYSQWTKIKAYCPICNELITRSYCRNCGIPNNNNGYFIYEDQLFRFGPPRFRPNDIIGEYQLCGKCGAPNPYNVNYCKSCGGDITLCAKDKNGHGWVDLGLSVLWSTEALRDGFRWNDSTIFYDLREEERHKEYLKYKNSNFGELGGSDAATHYWGKKWRTPTKEEFEELITKCTWEKCLIPDGSYNHSSYILKITGPNGNSIVIPLNFEPALNNCWSFNIAFWTSTSSRDESKAYSFKFRQEIEGIKTLTAKQKKANEFYESNNIRFKVELTKDESYSVRLGDFSAYAKLMEEKKRKKYPQYEKTLEQQRKILVAMGDDSQERRDNAKKDKEKLDNMWLTTPIKISTNEDSTNGMLVLKHTLKRRALFIRPVADKKWKGCL